MERDPWALFALLGPQRLLLDLFHAHDPPFMAFLDRLGLSDLYLTLLAGPYHLEAKEGRDQEQLEGLFLVVVKEARGFEGAKVNPLQLEVKVGLGLVGIKEEP